jgi:hypothetical protein
MRSALSLGVILSVALGSAACSRTADERGQMQEAAVAARDGGARGDEVTITGCLTSAPDRAAFVVTADRNALTSGALHAGDGETPTFTYELTGNTSNLTAHVGQQVQVTGRIDDDRRDDVKTDDETESKGARVQSGNGQVTPAIETDTELNIKVRRLEVSSVNATGRSCAQQGR